MNIMLFKKDLRVKDNLSLLKTIENSVDDFLCLYILEKKKMQNN